MGEEKQKIHSRIIIEMAGAPKEHLVKTMELFIQKMKEDEYVKLIGEETADPVEKDKMWSLFSEMEIEVKDIALLIGFCFDYMPSSVEIISPENFRLNSTDFAGMLNDMQGRLHEIDIVMKGMSAENQLLKKNGSMLLNNIILFLLKEGEKELAELSVGAGIPEDQLKKFLDVLVKNNKIKESGSRYSV